MTGHEAAVGIIFGTEPTDRALKGWQPPVWLELGTNAILRKEFGRLPLPVGYAWEWYQVLITGERSWHQQETT
jgi:hypothetical protein